jgi:ABC-type transport system substrate-binding protein
MRAEFTQRLETLNKDVQKLQQAAVKTRDPDKRQELQQEIAQIYLEMSSIRTQAQGLYRGSTPSGNQ